MTVWYFFKIVFSKTVPYSIPVSNFKHLQQRSFFRSSRSQMFFKIDVFLWNFTNFLEQQFLHNTSSGCFCCFGKSPNFYTSVLSESLLVKLLVTFPENFLWKTFSCVLLTCYLLMLCVLFKRTKYLSRTLLFPLYFFSNIFFPTFKTLESNPVLQKETTCENIISSFCFVLL